MDDEVRLMESWDEKRDICRTVIEQMTSRSDGVRELK